MNLWPGTTSFRTLLAGLIAMDGLPGARGADSGRDFLPHDAGGRSQILLPVRLVRCRGSNDTARTGA